MEGEVDESVIEGVTVGTPASGVQDHSVLEGKGRWKEVEGGERWGGGWRDVGGGEM